MDSTSVTNSTGCLAFGAEASVVEAALQATPALSYQYLTAKGTRSGTNITTDKSIFGILHVGDKVELSYGGSSSVPLAALGTANNYFSTITAVNSATEFVIDVAYDRGSNPLNIAKVIEDAVKVARYGTGNSTAQVVQVTQTATTGTHYQHKRIL